MNMFKYACKKEIVYALSAVMYRKQIQWGK